MDYWIKKIRTDTSLARTDVTDMQHTLLEVMDVLGDYHSALQELQQQQREQRKELIVLRTVISIILKQCRLKTMP